MQLENLVQEIGGPDAVFRIVKDMYRRVFEDPELAHFFEGVDPERLAKMQHEFIVSALGGPVKYSGAELSAIHTKRGITAAHYSSFVNHLADAMENSDVSKVVIDQVIGQLAMYRDRIIGAANVDG